MEALVIIGLIVLVAVLVVIDRLIRKAAHKAVHKGMDAVHNARVRKQEAENPPQKENLADRYKP